MKPSAQVIGVDSAMQCVWIQVDFEGVVLDKWVLMRVEERELEELRLAA
jgi:hypothetical protein